MHIVSPIMTTHSCESVAPIGCIALNISDCMSPVGIVAWHASTRGSSLPTAASGGGDGNMSSQVSGARFAGSWFRMSCRIVVPVRGRPTMKTGCTTSTWAISG